MSTTLGFLVGQAGEFSGLRIAIPETGLIIGRDPSQVDVVFRHQMVSRRHAQVAPDKKGQLYVVDLGSRNGIHVNGRKIVGGVPLNAGDKVDFGGSGQVVFIFETADTPSVTGILNQIFGETAASVDWKVGDTILGLYEVTGILGQGGMGRVYKIHHKSWNTDLAVKSPLPQLFAKEEAVENFVREAETWVNLNLHPNIVQCFYVRTIGGIPRIFAEFVPGGSLHEWIEKRKLTRLDQILDVAIQFAWGLHAAHEQGLVHQDVKPLNVLMTPDGVAKVSDFGLAKSRPVTGDALKTGPDNLVTMAGVFTQAYCSPEQAQGKRLSRKTDIWSFGVSLLHIFAGQLTWKHGFRAAKILEEYQRFFGPKLAVQMPKRLAKLLEQCFKLNLGERPKDMAEVAAELQGIYRDECGAVYPRREPTTVLHLADSLNNRAVSMLDLYRMQEAENIFEKAIKSDPHHPEAAFNLGVIRWRLGKITDIELVGQLEEVRKTHKHDWRADYFLGLIQAERGDMKSAVPILEEAAKLSGQLEVQTALNRIRNMAGNAPRCVHVFEGHAGLLTSVSLSADGQRVLLGSGKTLQLWEVATGQCVQVFQGHAGVVTSVSLSADGRWALSGGNDKTLRLWEVATGQCMRIFDGHISGVRSVCLSADGRWALSGSLDKSLRLWDVTTGRCARVFQGHTGGVTSISLSMDERWALSGSWDTTLRLWEVDTGQCVRVFNGHTSGVSSVALSVDNHWALSGSFDATFRFWKVLTGQCVRTFEEHEDEVRPVSFGTDGRWALLGGDKRLRLWNLAALVDDRPRPELHTRLSAVKSTEETIESSRRFGQLLPQAQTALRTGRYADALRMLRQARSIPGYERHTQALQAWNGLFCGCARTNLRTAWCASTFEGHTDSVRSVTLSADGRLALSGSHDKTLRLWEAATGRCVCIFEGHTDSVSSVSLSADNRWALSGSDDTTLRLWEVATGRCVRVFNGHAGSVKTACLSANNRWVLSGSFDCTSRLWEVATDRWVRAFGGLQTHVVSSVMLSADGRWALSGSYGTTLRLWDVATGQCVRAFDGHAGSISKVVLSSDGRWALSGSSDHTIRLWEIATGKCVRIFEGYVDISSVALTTDSRWVLSGDYDHTIRLWEVATGQCVRSLEGHAGCITSVGLSADGRWVLSGSSDKTVRLWELDWDFEVREAIDWDETARPHLANFLTLHTPYAAVLPTDCKPSEEEITMALTRKGIPKWSEEDFKQLLHTLVCAGFGWIRPEGVRRELEKMVGSWSK